MLLTKKTRRLAVAMIRIGYLWTSDFIRIGVFQDSSLRNDHESESLFQSPGAKLGSFMNAFCLDFHNQDDRAGATLEPILGHSVSKKWRNWKAVLRKHTASQMPDDGAADEVHLQRSRLPTLVRRLEEGGTRTQAFTVKRSFFRCGTCQNPMGGSMPLAIGLAGADAL